MQPDNDPPHATVPIPTLPQTQIPTSIPTQPSAPSNTSALPPRPPSPLISSSSSDSDINPDTDPRLSPPEHASAPATAPAPEPAPLHVHPPTHPDPQPVAAAHSMLPPSGPGRHATSAGHASVPGDARANAFFSSDDGFGSAGFSGGDGFGGGGGGFGGGFGGLGGHIAGGRSGGGGGGGGGGGFGGGFGGGLGGLSRRGSSSLLSSDSDSDSSTDALVFSTPRKRRPPRKVAGSKTSFILGDKLGEGAYAVVKEGIDESTLRIVAVKILDLRRLRRVRGGQEAIEREVSVQKRLKRHRNLVELIDVVRVPRRSKMYIVLEMANGCTLQELLDRAPAKRLPESQVAAFAHQVLVGLQYMHGKGVVHRDIKPSNLMLSAAGVVKISDFGVAEFLNEYQSDDNVSRTSGSPAFQAPEIARGEHGYSGMKVDVWALGVSVYLLVTGRIPFDADSLLALFDRIGAGEYTPLDTTAGADGAVSAECADAVRCMLTVQWKERASVDELLRHPWVVRAAAAQGGAAEERAKSDGWVAIPKKEFGILNIVKQMYANEEEDGAQEETMLAGTSSRSIPVLGTLSTAGTSMAEVPTPGPLSGEEARTQTPASEDGSGPRDGAGTGRVLSDRIGGAGLSENAEASCLVS